MPLEEHDPELFDLIEKEKNRSWKSLEMIASEVSLQFPHLEIELHFQSCYGVLGFLFDEQIL